VEGALGKLKPENVPYALENTKVGSISSMLQDSQNANREYGGQIKGILSSPTYVAHTGDGSAAIDDTLSQFKDSVMKTPEDVAAAVKQVAPGKAAIVDKVLSGDATLFEKNALRSEIDQNTYKNANDLPTLTFNKQVANSVANNLRNEVQTHAPETAPVFADYSKELNLQKALGNAQKGVERSGKLGLLDILSMATGGLPAVLGERVARSPAVSIATAKGASRLSGILPKLAPIGAALKTAATFGATKD